MIAFLLWQLFRVCVFGVALGFACRRFAGVKVVPPSLTPVVAVVFAVLNGLLYWLLALVLKVVSLWLLSLLVPLIANAILLVLTTKVVKALRIEGMIALAKVTSVVTAAHLLLRFVDWVF